MARIAKRPLKMANGVIVRTIEDLKNNFDIEIVVGYFLDGNLSKWLEARWYEEELEQVNSLDENDSELAKKLCDIFDVEYIDDIEIDTEDIIERKERLLKLKQHTDDEEIIANVDNVAFNQEELAELYDRGVEKIYLCEGDFKIPKSKADLQYQIISTNSIRGLNVEKKEQIESCQIYHDTPIFCEKIGCRLSNTELLKKGNQIFYYEDNKIIKKENERSTVIMQSAHHNYKDICTICNYIIFTHSVGNHGGTHLCVYFSDIDVYQEIEKFTHEFTVGNGHIYYIKNSDPYTYSHSELYKCNYDGSDKKLIKDFGKAYVSYYDLKIANNKIYYKYIDTLFPFCPGPEHTGFIDLIE